MCYLSVDMICITFVAYDSSCILGFYSFWVMIEIEWINFIFIYLKPFYYIKLEKRKNIIFYNYRNKFYYGLIGIIESLEND